MAGIGIYFIKLRHHYIDLTPDFTLEMNSKSVFKNYILQVHKEPHLLKRLIDRLNDDRSQFFIHVDVKFDIEPFTKLINYNNVHFIAERHNVIWGDYSQVIATLALLRAVFEANIEGRIIFLSGQCYPIKPLHHITSYLEEHEDIDFVEFEAVQIERILKHKVNFTNRRGHYFLIGRIRFNQILTKDFYLNLFKHAAALLLMKPGIKYQWYAATKNRTISLFDYHFKGSSWWSFTINTSKKIYQYYLDHKEELDHYYSNTLCSDEQFFQTILMKLMEHDYSIQIDRYLHFIDWNRVGEPLPAVLKMSDFDTLVQQPDRVLFARKFDPKKCPEILDEIDRQILDN